MIDGNHIRAEFARYLHEHTHTRWGLDAALMHVGRICYDQGVKDGEEKKDMDTPILGSDLPDGDYMKEAERLLDEYKYAAEMVADPLSLSRILHELAGAASLCWEPRPTGVFDSQLAIQFVEQALAEIRSRMTPTPAEVPMPEPVAYGFGNTAITGHTNRLMMVRIDIPGGDQYAGAFWLPLVLADEAHTYGAACRAAGEAAGYARGLAEGRERCAVEAWMYYMDTCKRNGIGPDVCPQWCCAAALRGEVKP